MNKKLRIANIVMEIALIVTGLAGIVLNLLHIDGMVMNHFEYFVWSSICYVVSIIIGIESFEKEDF